MSLTNNLENEILGLLFNNTNVSDIGDPTGLQGSGTAGSYYVSLHTSSPGEAGTQATNEATYGSYARVSVARSAAGWTISGNSVSPTNPIDFAESTGGSETITHVGIGTSASGTGKLILYGAISPAIAVTIGIIPRIRTTSTITLD